MIQKTGVSLRSATLADKNTNTTKEISLVVFSVGNSLRKPPSEMPSASGCGGPR